MSSIPFLSASPSAAAGTVQSAASGDLRAVLFLGCIALFLLVFVFMLGALWHHRLGVLRQGGRPFHASALVELVWSLIPIAIVVAMAWPAVRVVWSRLVAQA
ncbi:hypothetical protein KIK84_15730 [Curvibacter sp. CHRR-16]|uniref:cytochrome c oxidase subunit II transmembrane domain-containing protein n=1 Tax=Curvibacter sp. CHRR-16 TaxID=2835872 RepID=UPI001BDAAD1A|nr:cytochrome c oxidase subunit II transmembrane domain-containing protein [Curvibacter sp. CHRR-16]MBT0571772.1 hypothetical protein [Curvibacter sp. CHRR-16]